MPGVPAKLGPLKLTRQWKSTKNKDVQYFLLKNGDLPAILVFREGTVWFGTFLGSLKKWYRKKKLQGEVLPKFWCQPLSVLRSWSKPKTTNKSKDTSGKNTLPHQALYHQTTQVHSSVYHSSEKKNNFIINFYSHYPTSQRVQSCCLKKKVITSHTLSRTDTCHHFTRHLSFETRAVLSV